MGLSGPNFAGFVRLTTLGPSLRGDDGVLGKTSVVPAQAGTQNFPSDDARRGEPSLPPIPRLR
ncbi:hypothetical protein GCM10017655_52450 [Pseudomonas turukhanskensis]|uniref:Uncharacterized protein n=1 Tax=Pseudomonas turukhanskensis TaxID=1806536 RepID=A0A9W6KDB6_9PSED|nr:hypothetical protein GCM10017655_52450 [Pseudomonas turukhanskensis]